MLHRKNALFYKSLNGAAVGDLFMSLTTFRDKVDINHFAIETNLARANSSERRPP